MTTKFNELYENIINKENEMLTEKFKSPNNIQKGNFPGLTDGFKISSNDGFLDGAKFVVEIAVGNDYEENDESLVVVTYWSEDPWEDPLYFISYFGDGNDKKAMAHAKKVDKLIGSDVPFYKSLLSLNFEYDDNGAYDKGQIQEFADTIKF